MYKIYISVKKELLLFLHDKVGLGLMFLMPIILVFIITIIQDSAFKIVESNKITLLIANHDKGDLGKRLSSQLAKTGMFEVIVNNTLKSGDLKERVSNKEALTALYISEDFTDKLEQKSHQISGMIVSDLGLGTSQKATTIKMPSVLFFHDPVLQENYCYSIINVINAHLKGIESMIMIEGIYGEMGTTSIPPHLTENILNNQIIIERINAASENQKEIPNSTQHNVPAWTIFAMFFMVVSLGTNIVKERTSGSFSRIKTMPTKFSLILYSKQFLYLIIAILQVFVIFSIGTFIFPLINLPMLVFPSNMLGTIIIIVMCSLSAVSYALMVGSLVKTEEQANGFGAISILIFASLGGVLVPTFIMPNYMQTISLFSPLHWCIEGFYVLFLKNGDWVQLSKPILILLAFSIVCQLIAYFRLRFARSI